MVLLDFARQAVAILEDHVHGSWACSWLAESRPTTQLSLAGGSHNNTTEHGRHDGALFNSKAVATCAAGEARLLEPSTQQAASFIVVCRYERFQIRRGFLSKALRTSGRTSRPAALSACANCTSGAWQHETLAAPFQAPGGESIKQVETRLLIRQSGF